MDEAWRTEEMNEGVSRGIHIFSKKCGGIGDGWMVQMGCHVRVGGKGFLNGRTIFRHGTGK